MLELVLLKVAHSSKREQTCSKKSIDSSILILVWTKQNVLVIGQFLFQFKKFWFGPKPVDWIKTVLDIQKNQALN